MIKLDGVGAFSPRLGGEVYRSQIPEFDWYVAHWTHNGSVEKGCNLVLMYEVPRVVLFDTPTLISLTIPEDIVGDTRGYGTLWDASDTDRLASGGAKVLITTPQSIPGLDVRAPNGEWYVGAYDPDKNVLYVTDWLHYGSSGIATFHKFYPLVAETLAEAGFPIRRVVPPATEARTQKARGIMALHQVGLGPIGIDPVKGVVVQSLDEVEEAFRATPKTGGKVFARPCPIRPRHGFVESRLASSPGEVRAIFEEALREDPEAEMVLMPPILAKFNAIVTPSGATIGVGHDGATAGRDALYIPAPPGELLPIWPHLLSEGEVPYVEMVHDGKVWWATQYRSGPPTNGVDYIPKLMVVRRVYTLTQEMDLLEWEKVVKDLPQGTVVYHPGGSLASHYGVHCVASGVPYITSHEPKIGERLRPTGGWTSEDYHALARFVAGWFERPTDNAKALPLALGVVHSIASFRAIKPSPEMLRLLAWGIVYLARATAGASLGEIRYSPRREEVSKALGYTIPRGSDGRDAVYRRALGFGLPDVTKALVLAYTDFKRPWKSGYGGRAWATSTKAALAYAKAIATFLAKPGQTTLGERLMAAANRLLHVNHNNGWYLGKWGNPTLYDPRDMAAKGPLWLIVQYPGEVLRYAKADLPEVDPKEVAKATLLMMKSVSEALATTGAITDFREACLSRSLTPNMVKDFLTKAQVCAWVKGLLDTVKAEFGSPVPGDAEPVYAQHTPLWNESAHIQIRLPVNKGRDYGGVIDVPPKDNVHEALYFYMAFVWGATFDGPRKSLNASDSVNYYAPLKAWWNGERVWVEVPDLLEGGTFTLRLPAYWT